MVMECINSRVCFWCDLWPSLLPIYITYLQIGSQSSYEALIWWLNEETPRRDVESFGADIFIFMYSHRKRDNHLQFSFIIFEQLQYNTLTEG